jgi:AAHS family 4-hydroxybenzoate transporter-like MFS transporter
MIEPPVSPTEAALEEQPVGGLQLRVAALCALVLASDGYDIGAIGMAVPSLSHVWHLPAAAFSPAFVLSSIGILVGALVCGPLGDRIGRKPILLAATATIAVFTLLCAFAESLTQLALLRFMTGIGIGGIMPTAVALTADYTPRRYRATFVMVMFCGTPMGGFVGGQIVAQILPHFGWRSIFLLGCAWPLLMLPVLALWLPESVRFIVAKGARTARQAALLTRMKIAPNAAGRADVAAGNPVAMLFGNGLAPSTILLWFICGANLLTMYLLAYWLPAVLHLTGLSPADAVFAASLHALGGVLSVFYLGPAIDRFGPRPVLVANFLSGVLFIGAIALVHLPYAALLMVIFGSGAATSGSQHGVNAFAAVLYPARMRASGVAWALGVGRLGGIAAPALGGFLLAQGWPPPHIFLAACATALFAAAATALLGLSALRAPDLAAQA